MIEYRPATQADDADLRALMRENAMPSWVSMSFEREPSFFAGVNRFGRDHVVIARDAMAPVGMYVGSEHRAFVNGQPIRVGYLGGLRVNGAFRQKLSILRGGFDSVRALAGDCEIPFWYTSIGAGNRTARRVLEANLPGMPRYVPVGEMLTLAMPAARGRRLGIWQPVPETAYETLAAAWQASACRYQFAPCLDAAAMVQTGARFFSGGSACMALWDQTACKQVVARAYRQPLAAMRPLHNLWARLARRVCLPRANESFKQCHLAFLALSAYSPTDTVAAIRDALSLAPCDVLTLGLHADHPALGAVVRAFKPLMYRTIIYTVSFGASPQLDPLPVQPEVAVL